MRSFSSPARSGGPANLRNLAGLRLRDRPSLHFVLLCAFLMLLWLAGGASRGDAAGQVVVRSFAWVGLVAAILLGRRSSLGAAKPVAYLLAAIVILTVFQLIPLPATLWLDLPGREVFAQAITPNGAPQPWRPLTIAPGATINSASSLVVPVAMLVFLAGLKPIETTRLLSILLALISALALVGILQFTGLHFDNPMINETVGSVSGMIANRNHFAMLVSLGCIFAPVWAFEHGHQPSWRVPAALGLLFVFVLVILATGSRAGMLTGMLSIALGLAIVHRAIRRSLNHYPRWVFPALLLAIAIGIVAMVMLSVAADRAVSIQRATMIDIAQDMRSRGLPTVLALIQSYFPFGVGAGAFDPAFRMAEPFELLKLSYFNHAHNDLLEVVLEAGAAGLVLLVTACGWWAITSVRAWRAGSGTIHARPKLGSAMLLVVFVASAFDYPARTPIVMAMIIIAAVWLSGEIPIERPAARRNQAE